MEEKKVQAPEKTLEEALEELDAISEKLEDTGASLEESFRLYRSGMDLLKYCNDKLKKKKKKMLQMSEEGNLSEFQ